ncbi:MAG TPA: RluA family pseudouridine synthase [Deltaproteobacteria bacterium]|nr:RluA family pseudouridine synthase [Deltaproteobacteria bacterium]
MPALQRQRKNSVGRQALKGGAAVIPNPQIPLRILYEDPYLLAVDKAPGLPCHPLRSGESQTLANAVVARFPQQAHLNPAREAGLVHRLDNDTSGVILFARDAETLQKARALSQGGQMRKIYLARVEGRLQGRGFIDFPIAHHPKSSKKMIVAKNPAQAKKWAARDAETRYQALRLEASVTLLRVEIKVGSRHQIRVHLAALGHPLLGDKLYGAKQTASRLYLHASEIILPHPRSGKKLRIRSPAPF